MYSLFTAIQFYILIKTHFTEKFANHAKIKYIFRIYKTSEYCTEVTLYNIINTKIL